MNEELSLFSTTSLRCVSVRKRDFSINDPQTRIHCASAQCTPVSSWLPHPRSSAHRACAKHSRLVCRSICFPSCFCSPAETTPRTSFTSLEMHHCTLPAKSPFTQNAFFVAANMHEDAKLYVLSFPPLFFFLFLLLVFVSFFQTWVPLPRPSPPGERRFPSPNPAPPAHSHRLGLGVIELLSELW